MSTDLDKSGAIAGVAPALLKALAFLSDTTVRKYKFDQQDLKSNWKKGYISPGDQLAYYF